MIKWEYARIAAFVSAEDTDTGRVLRRRMMLLTYAHGREAVDIEALLEQEIDESDESTDLLDEWGKAMADAITRLGGEGWELVGVTEGYPPRTRIVSTANMWFKRPVNA